MDALHLRHAQPDDAADIAAIYAPIVESTAISFEVVPPTADEMRERIETISLAHAWLVSLDERGKVNGYAYGSKHRDRAAYQWSVDCTAYVRADCRGQGVGRRLYGKLFELLAQQGYFQVFAGITLPNAASVGLHEAMGFHPVGVYRNVGFKLGQWHDVGWWQKELRPSARPSAIQPLPVRL